MHELEYIRKVLLERTKTTMFGSVGMPKYGSFYIHTAHASIEVRYMVNVGRPYIELDAHYHERSKRSRSGLVYDNFVDGIHAWVDNFNQECVREYSENLPNLLQSNKDKRNLHNVFLGYYGPQVGKLVGGNFKVGRFTINMFYTKRVGGDLRVRFHHEDKGVNRDTTVIVNTTDPSWAHSTWVIFVKELDYSFKREKELAVEAAKKAAVAADVGALVVSIQTALESAGFRWVSQNQYKRRGHTLVALPILPNQVQLGSHKTNRTFASTTKTVCKIENLGQAATLLVTLNDL